MNRGHPRIASPPGQPGAPPLEEDLWTSLQGQRPQPEPGDGRVAMARHPAKPRPVSGLPRIAGIDEAGRGPLAGPVVVAAVVLDPGRPRINGLDDSKRLPAVRRERLQARIMERALAWSVVFVEVEEIDRLNILQATLAGMRRALDGVLHAADLARIDGNCLPPGLPCPAEAWVGGDARDRAIMAASILAKVARDQHMQRLHARWPQYGFDVHKGYATPAHRAALERDGPCPEHRRSFAPVRLRMEQGELALSGTD